MTNPAATLPNNARAAIVDALNGALADTIVATMLAQNFHWNVTGMNFGALHALFQEIYEDHFAGQDELAERVRALDGIALGQLSEVLARTRVAEHSGEAPAEAMIAALQRAEETIAAALAQAGALAAEQGDTLSEDLAIARGQQHEKFAWMLRAHLA